MTTSLRILPIWVSLLALIGFVALTFSQVKTLDFTHYDDPANVHANPFLIPPTWSNVAQAWRKPYHFVYMPVTYTVWGILTKVARLDASWSEEVPTHEPVLEPAYFHLTNVAVHAATTCLVFWLCLLFKNQTAAAFFGAAVFALHPIQVEPVAWVSGLRDLLAGFFGIGFLIAWIAAEKEWGRLASAFLYVLALLSKPTAVVFFPLAVFLLLLRNRVSLRPRLASSFLLGALALASVVITTVVQSGSDAIPFRVPPPTERLVVFLDALGFYVRKLILPLALCIDYTRTPERIFQDSETLLHLALSISLLAYAVYRFRSLRCLGLTFGFVVCFLPVSGLQPFAHQFLSTVADRYAYPAMVIVALAAAFLSQHMRGRDKKITWTLSTILLLGFGLLSHLQVEHWRDTRALFSHALKVEPESWHSHFMLGSRELAEGKLDSAERHFRTSVQLHRNEQAFTRLGEVFLRRQQYDLAIGALEEVVHLRPEAPEARENLAFAWKLRERQFAQPAR